MAAYKDEARGTWYVSFHYNDWTGKNKRKLKRGFRTRKEALEYEQKFLLQQARIPFECEYFPRKKKKVVC